MQAEEARRPLALVVDDDEAGRSGLVDLVRLHGFEVAEAASVAEAREALARRPPDLVLLDLLLPDGTGEDLLEQLEQEPTTAVLLITGHATTDSAISALRAGVLDYLTKPVDLDRLERLLGWVRERTQLRVEIHSLRAQLRDVGRFGSIIGVSEPMQKVYDLLEKVAPTEASVFLVGESGTGKELAASMIHRLSRRSKQPYLAVNCGAISPTLIESELFGHEKGSFTGAHRQHKGVFERGSGGTIFLDELTEMPIELQVKLLRVLESGRITRVGGREEIAVDLRVIAATNREPEGAVEDGRLREDLLYRLKVFPIVLPPLRDRGEDAEILAVHFLDELNRENESHKRFDPEVLDLVLRWHWPGNVRELKNVIRRAFILADDVVDRECLPRELTGEEPPRGPTIQLRVGMTLEEADRALTLATLDQLDGNKTQTAKVLGISVKTLYNHLKKYGKME